MRCYCLEGGNCYYLLNSKRSGIFSLQSFTENMVNQFKVNEKKMITHFVVYLETEFRNTGFNDE